MKCGARLIVKIVPHLLSDQLLLTERVSGLVRHVVHWALVHLEIQKSQLGKISDWTVIHSNLNLLNLLNLKVGLDNEDLWTVNCGKCKFVQLQPPSDWSRQVMSKH